MKNLKLYFNDVRTFDRKMIGLLVLTTLFSLSIIVLTSILPAFIVSYLERFASISKLIQPLAFLIVGLIVLTYIAMNLEAKFASDAIRVRILGFSSRMTEKFITMDYDLVESDDLMKTYDKAGSSFINNNNSGSEALLVETKNFFINLLALIIFGFLLGSFNPLAFILVLLVALVRYISLKRSRKFRAMHKQEWSDLNSKRRHLKLEALKVENGKDMRLYEVQDLYKEKLERLTEERLKWRKKEAQLEFENRIFGIVAVLLRDAFVFIYLVNAVLDGMSLAEFTLFFTLMSSFNVWIQAILESQHRLSIGIQDVDDFMEFIDYDQERDNKTEPVAKSDGFTLEFVDVSYRYPNQTEDTISNLNLKLDWGEKLALVGVNGAGKSTIVKIMMGLIQPTSGQVLMNGCDVQTLNKVDYAKLFAPVFQEDDVWALTLQENVAMKRDDLDLAKVKEVIQTVGLSDKFTDLNANLTRHLYNDGFEMSGGETQKLMLARALYKDAPILVLDEPTAALDALAEAKLYEQYETFSKNKSALFISHRLSSTKFCHRIIFLEHGKIVESGSHDELLAIAGKYAEMFAVQSQYYKEASQ